jgi:para-nitrobenzyl esterase
VATGLFNLGPDATAADLRKVDAEVFAIKTMDGPHGEPDADPIPVPGLAPVPAIDGVVLTKKIRAAFKAGEQKHLPLIVGSTSNEASILAAFKMDPGDLMAGVIEAGGRDMEDAVENLKGLYRGDPEVKPGDLDDPDRFASLVLRDILFTMQARWISDHQSKKKSSWRYYFSYVTEADRPDYPHGVAHGNDVIHTLGTGDIFVNSKDTFTDNDRTMSGKVTDYWFSFANTGTPRWDRIVDQERVRLPLGRGIRPRTTP